MKTNASCDHEATIIASCTKCQKEIEQCDGCFEMFYDDEMCDVSILCLNGKHYCDCCAERMEDSHK